MPRSILDESRIHPAIRERVASHQQAIVKEVQAAVGTHAVVVVGMGGVALLGFFFGLGVLGELLPILILLLELLGVGEVVGELALLTGSPRSATIRCPENDELFRLDKAGFDAPLGHVPGLLGGVRWGVRAERGAGRSENGRGLAQLDVFCPTRYLDAFRHYQRGEPISRAWGYTFRMAERREPLLSLIHI